MVAVITVVVSNVCFLSFFLYSNQTTEIHYYPLLNLSEIVFGGTLTCIEHREKGRINKLVLAAVDLLAVL